MTLRHLFIFLFCMLASPVAAQVLSLESQAVQKGTNEPRLDASFHALTLVRSPSGPFSSKFENVLPLFKNMTIRDNGKLDGIVEIGLSVNESTKVFEAVIVEDERDPKIIALRFDFGLPGYLFFKSDCGTLRYLNIQEASVAQFLEQASQSNDNANKLAELPTNNGMIAVRDQDDIDLIFSLINSLPDENLAEFSLNPRPSECPVS